MTEALIGRSHKISIPHEFGSYRFESVIGHGSFAVVILVSRLTDNQLFACKVVSQQYLIENKLVESFQREVEAFSKFNHPNVLKLFEFLNDDKLIYLIMEYCAKGDLLNYISHHGQLTENQARIIFREILQAVDYLHRIPLAHRDLKLENILLDENMKVKLADFGFIKPVSNDTLMKTKCGTPIYAAPELISQADYDGRAADMWSLGVILYVLLVGKIPWETTNETQLFFQIRTARFHIPETINPNAAKLISELMCPRPEMRITAPEALCNRWILGDDRHCQSTPLVNRPLLKENGRQTVRIIPKRMTSSIRVRDTPLTKRNVVPSFHDSPNAENSKNDSK